MTRIEETSTQTQELMHQMLSSWSETQQEVIEQWLDMIEGHSEPPSAALWKQTLSVWEATVKRTMEAQNATMNSWISQVQEVEGMPEEAKRRVEEGKAIMKRWTEVQSTLWEKWFEMMRQMDPGSYEANWQEAVKQSVSTWRDYTQQMQRRSEEVAEMASNASSESE